MQQLEEPAKTELLAGLDDVSRGAIVGLLAYPENTAGAMMTTEFVSVPGNWTVEQTLQHIRKVERSRETVYAIYVLDPVTRVLSAPVTLRPADLRRAVRPHPDAGSNPPARHHIPAD